MSDSLTQFLLVLVGSMLAFDLLGVNVIAEAVAYGFVVVVLGVAVFKLMVLNEASPSPRGDS